MCARAFQAGPGVFGLHENANIMCAQVEAFDMFNTILLMNASSGGGGGGGATREEIIGASAADAEARLKRFGQFDIEQISLLYPVKYEESMNTVLLQVFFYKNHIGLCPKRRKKVV